MHWLYITLLFLIISVWTFSNIDVSVIAGTGTVAAWLSAVAATVSSIAALVAAILLRRTLKESQEATKLMRDQLMQNRAYMTVDVTDVQSIHDDSKNIVGVILRINWKNTGLSPAIDVRSGGSCGYCKYKVGDEISFDVDTSKLLGGLPGSVVAVGNRSMGRAQFKMTDIAESIRLGEKPIIQSACSYSDIYGRKYLARYTALVNWNENILNPSLVEHVLKDGTDLVPIGSKNNEINLTSNDISNCCA